jgi:hypothetical protein
MTTLKPFLCLLAATLMWTGCRTQIKVKEEDKIFHAGPVNSGFGGIFFGLFKDNKYEFCDGDFMNPGCYTGLYTISGDTIILLELRKHDGIPTNKFIIRRYRDMDSSYWIWKYPEHKINWQSMRNNDAIGSTGDIFPLDKMNKIVYDRNHYFLIRMDSLQNSH